jgi:hypothetical protein
MSGNDDPNGSLTERPTACLIRLSSQVLDVRSLFEQCHPFTWQTLKGVTLDCPAAVGLKRGEKITVGA